MNKLIKVYEKKKEEKEFLDNILDCIKNAIMKNGAIKYSPAYNFFSINEKSILSKFGFEIKRDRSKDVVSGWENNEEQFPELYSLLEAYKENEKEYKKIYNEILDGIEKHSIVEYRTSLSESVIPIFKANLFNIEKISDEVNQYKLSGWTEED